MTSDFSIATLEVEDFDFGAVSLKFGGKVIFNIKYYIHPNLQSKVRVE